MAMGFRALLPVVTDEACMVALSAFREVYPKLANEVTKLMRVAQVSKTTWGDTGMCDRMAFCFESLFAALRRQDVKEEEVSTTWLVGADEVPGFLQLCGMKKAILDFMFRAVHQAVDHRRELQESGGAIIRYVLPKFRSPHAMCAAFMPREQTPGIEASSGDAGLAAGENSRGTI